MDDPTPPRPAVVGSFQPVPAADPAAKAAVTAALAKLAGDAATRRLDLAAPEVRLVERQIVAGTIFRATLRVGAQGHRRLLRPWLLQEACEKAGIPLTLRMQEGYDHSYYFISTFMEDHLKWHAERLSA